MFLNLSRVREGHIPSKVNLNQFITHEFLSAGISTNLPS